MKAEEKAAKGVKEDVEVAKAAQGGEQDAEVSTKKAGKGSNREAEEIKKELEDLKVRKTVATKAENYKEAKRLKEVQKALEERLKKLEL